MRDKLKQKRGSIVLELAIALPLFLFALAFMLSAIMAQRQSLMMRHALDQTASELEVLIPLVEDGSKLILGEAAIEEVLGQIMPVQGEILRSAALDLASSELLSGFLQKRLDFWLQSSGRALKLKIPEHERQLLLLWRDEGKSLLLSLRYEVTTVWSRHPQRTLAYVPLWLSTEGRQKSGGEEEDEEDNIWSAGNFERGRYFREQFGANLPFNTPSIAYFEAGTARGIRSLDLTAPSYVDSSHAEKELSYEISRLAQYRGGKIPGGGEIKSSDIQRRELWIVIPSNSPENYQGTFWERMRQEAAAQGVELKVIRKLKSYRYAEGNE